MRRATHLLLLVGLAMSAVAACGSSGREMRPPVAGAASPTRSTSTVSGAGSSFAPAFTLASSAFATSGSIPARYTCGGPSPELAWSGVPAGTSELVLAVVDPDADGFVHWLVTGIAPRTGAISQGQVPTGAQELPNSAGASAWLAPCPPPGQAHTYHFILLALAQPSAVPAGTPSKDAVAILQTAAQGRLSVITASARAPGQGTQPGTARVS